MNEQCSDLVKEAEFFFPEGILSEILSWLEVKYLLRCKSVCKLWYAIINNKQFAGMHEAHDGRRSFHYINSESLDTKSVNKGGIKQKNRLLGCIRLGFLLVERSSLATSDMSAATYHLINPSTKCILDLPDPHKTVCAMMIHQYSSTNLYYVLPFYIDEENKKHKIELLDLGGQCNDPCPNANLSWRTLYISEYERLRKQQKYTFSYAVCDGILYILVLLEIGLSNPKIICFDIVKQQSCTTLDVPDQSLRFNSREVHFQLWRGKPAVSFVSKQKFNAWVLEDYSKQKWADIQIPLPFLKQSPSLSTVIPYIYFDDEREVSLVYKKEPLKWWTYNLKLKQMCTIPSRPKRVPATLVSVKGMQPEKKKNAKLKTS